MNGPISTTDISLAFLFSPSLCSLISQQCPCKFCPEPTGCFEVRRAWPLYVIPPDCRIRRACRYLIDQKWFDYSVLFFIALNCITLAMERPDIPRHSIVSHRDITSIVSHRGIYYRPRGITSIVSHRGIYCRPRGITSIVSHRGIYYRPRGITSIVSHRGIYYRPRGITSIVSHRGILQAAGYYKHSKSSGYILQASGYYKHSKSSGYILQAAGYYKHSKSSGYIYYRPRGITFRLRFFC